MILVGLAPDQVERLEDCAPEVALVCVATLDDAVAWLEEAAHAAEVHSGPQVVDGLKVDLELHLAEWRGHELTVTEQELKLLACLASEPGRARAFDELYEHAWGTRYVHDRGSVQAAVKRLRGKLVADAPDIQIEAVRGFGFRMVVRPDAM